MSTKSNAAKPKQKTDSDDEAVSLGWLCLLFLFGVAVYNLFPHVAFLFYWWL